MRHAFARIDPQLLAAVERLGGRGQHFTNPIRRERQVRVRRHVRQPRAAPAGDIRHEHIVSEVQLGLQENYPSARALVVKRLVELGKQCAGSIRVRKRRPRRRVEIAVEHLGDEVVGDLAQVVIRGAFLQRFRAHFRKPRIAVVCRVMRMSLTSVAFSVSIPIGWKRRETCSRWPARCESPIGKEKARPGVYRFVSLRGTNP